MQLINIYKGFNVTHKVVNIFIPYFLLDLINNTTHFENISHKESKQLSILNLGFLYIDTMYLE